jgi:DNA polymerase I
MLAAYQSGDPYLSFGQQAGAIPPDGTKATHPTLRDQFKACVLAVQYGMGSASLSDRIGQPPARARQLLQLHREAYPTFWRWSAAAVDQAFLAGSLQTVFGWPIRTSPEANGRSLSNFPMQANGAEMLRLACIAATEQDVRVCAPVHDALLIEAPLDQLDAAISTTQQAMRDASAAVLGGFELRSDACVIGYPDRYMDERGAVMWDRIMRILDESERADTGQMVASE